MLFIEHMYKLCLKILYQKISEQWTGPEEQLPNFLGRASPISVDRKRRGTCDVQGLQQFGQQQDIAAECGEIAVRPSTALAFLRMPSAFLADFVQSSFP